MNESRRTFLSRVASTTFGVAATASLALRAKAEAMPEKTSFRSVIDTHMHVWGNDPTRYPFHQPYVSDFKQPPTEATLEMCVDEMNSHGCEFSVLVQCIYHGWDNSYIADCVATNPKKFRGHGLVDPTDPQVADKFEYWIKDRGLHGMRFSPIYYRDGQHGGDGWVTAEHSHRAWRKADELGAVLNFFIAPAQLPKLAEMVKTYRDVPVIIDHISQLDLSVADPEPDILHLLDMAKHPNVHVKISELSSVSKSKTYPFADAYPVVQRVYEAFGPNRLLFGTGYPGAARATYKRPSLDEEVALIAEKMTFFTDEDRAKILGLNAARIWSFSLSG